MLKLRRLISNATRNTLLADTWVVQAGSTTLEQRDAPEPSGVFWFVYWQRMSRIAINWTGQTSDRSRRETLVA